ncbi:16S rRNA methyltransferase [Oxyplasma meridianum]|uniref:Ribosomal RNA small subunit methyltransferase Nep1 n=1 Tax=Oxyplasma meridianum TaxID=3073602 RepID=A0AAX4NEG9_9ARCH
MINLIIADAEIEFIPAELSHDFNIINLAKKRGKSFDRILLDSNYMHSSIDKHFPGESNRRGRPDIIHTLLMVVQDSILNKEKQIRVIIHTRMNKIITINQETRLPRSYNRFTGLLESLFVKGRIESDGTVLMECYDGTLKDALRMVNSEHVVVLSPSGEKKPIDQITEENETTYIIGGFSEGDYISDAYSMGRSCSIYRDELTIWTVASEIICSTERRLGLV